MNILNGLNFKCNFSTSNVHIFVKNKEPPKRNSPQTPVGGTTPVVSGTLCPHPSTARVSPEWKLLRYLKF